jgi:hypothetical protein
MLEALPPIEPQQALFGLVAGGLSILAKTGLGRAAVGTVTRGAGRLISTVAGTTTRRVGLSAGAGVLAGEAVSIGSGLRNTVPAGSALRNTGPAKPLVTAPPQVFTGPVMPGYAPAPDTPAGRASAAAMGDLALTLPVEYSYVARPPRGYVTVMYAGQKLFMLKGCARDLGLWKPRPKPPISTKNWNALKRARTAQRQVDRAAETAASITGCSTSSRRRSSSSRKSGGRRRRKDGRFA